MKLGIGRQNWISKRQERTVCTSRTKTAISRNTSGFCNIISALETKMRKLLLCKMDVTASPFSGRPAVPETSEEELLPVQVTGGDT